MSEKKTRKLTRKQQKLVDGIIAGKTIAQAARDAGYAEKTPGTAAQAGHQALKAVEERVRDAMDRQGHTLDELIEKHLDPVLEAKETKFFPFRKTVFVQPTDEKGKPVGERVEDTVQVIETSTVVNLQTKATGLDIAFRLRGDYAPKQIDTDPQASDAPKVIYAGGIPRFNR